jgi:hypothetical protein
MPKVKIEGVNANFDGEYELRIGKDESLKTREFRAIKKISGHAPTEFAEAIVKGDVEAVAAIAAITLHRNGKGLNVPLEGLAEVLMADSDFGAISVDFGTFEGMEEDDDRPPASSPTTSGPENKPAAPSSENEKNEPSGAPSGTELESQEPSLRAIGGLS